MIKSDTRALLSYLREAKDDQADGTLSDVTIAVLMAFLYAIDPRTSDTEEGAGKVTLLSSLYAHKKTYIFSSVVLRSKLSFFLLLFFHRL